MLITKGLRKHHGENDSWRNENRQKDGDGNNHDIQY